MTAPSTRELAERYWHVETVSALERTVRHDMHAAIADELVEVLGHLIETSADSGAIAYVEGRLNGHQGLARGATNELDQMPSEVVERISAAIQKEISK